MAITARTYRLTEQGHITDRYTKAIEQLGSAKLDVRLGGVYALERIAVDSKRDHPTVVEVLSAFIREHSDQAHTDSELSIADVLSRLLHSDREPAAESQPNGDAERKPKPATDVQAALTVLGRLPKRPDVSRGDLSDAQLAGARLNRANLAGALLNGADLSRAHLSGADLSGARLVRADLSGASFGGADLSGAQLAEADLSGAWGIRAKLSGAGLGGANLSGAGLLKADLSRALLGGADLSRAQLNGRTFPAPRSAESPFPALGPMGRSFPASLTEQTSQAHLASRRHSSTPPLVIRQLGFRMDCNGRLAGRKGLGFRATYNGQLAGQAMRIWEQRHPDNLMPVPSGDSPSPFRTTVKRSPARRRCGAHLGGILPRARGPLQARWPVD